MRKRHPASGKKPNIRRLRELLSYNATTGKFTWLVSRGGKAIAGATAGRLRPDGYCVIGVDLKFYYAHRLAWLYVHGTWPVQGIDHKNGNPSDNRIANLRLATQTQNNANARKRSDNRSGLKGVSWSQRDKCWRSFLTRNGEKRYLGSFQSAAEAHAAYCNASKGVDGPFWRVG